MFKTRIQKHIAPVLAGLLLSSGISSASSVRMMEYFHPTVEGACWYYNRSGDTTAVTAVRVKVEDPNFELEYKGKAYGLKIAKSRIVAKISNSVTKSSKGSLESRTYWPESYDYYGPGKNFSIYGTDDIKETDYFRFAPGIEFPEKFRIGKPLARSCGLLGQPYRGTASSGWRLGPEMKWQTEVTGKETISVPAGVFKDCIHVRHTVTVGTSAGETADEWWAKGVGKVRAKYTGKKNAAIVEDLVQYIIPSTIPPLQVVDVTVRSPFDLTGPFDFGAVTIGQAPSERTISIRNMGAVAITGLTASTSDRTFRTKAAPIPYLAPGEKVKIKVEFSPKKVGKSLETLRIHTTAPAFLPYEVPITGRGVSPWK